MTCMEEKRGPTKRLCLMAVNVGILLFCCGLYDGPISENIFRSGQSQTIVALLLVAALVQFLLLRSELLVVAKWLPIIFSAVGIALSVIVDAEGGWIAAFWLALLSVPLYLGSAAVIFLYRLVMRLDG
ncbi:hypothetical protein [uncultured Oscillibacter sp.]|uniref:hypothetical protein n=1 Tax=uncultured Oscillibacter sp. TaxID=876091 RepID=UPI0025CDE3C9|nr:hypothetical protein [uncultured Oscillibacter sp.]